MTVPKLTLSSRVVVSRDQVSADLSGESVVLGMRDGVYYGLDAVASRIWALLQEPRLLSDVAATIEAEFDVTRDRAAADLLTFAADLAAHGLVDVVAD